MISEEMTSSDQQDLAQRPPSVHARPPEQQHQLGSRPAHHDDGITIVKIQKPQTPNPCLHTKFQNHSTFPSGIKAITLQERKKKKVDL